MKREDNNKSIVSFAVFFLFLFISYGIISYSSTLTHSTVCGDLDSYCYRYFGMLIAKGGIPYLDAFDNKGPLLYFLNFIGYIISKKFGVFIVEFVFMTLYLSVQYAIARRFADVKRSLIYTVAAVGPIGAFFVGNMTEEYALFFISVGLLVFIDYFLFDKKEWYRIVICGLACGAVLMIKPNMIAVWAVFCIYAVCLNIRQNKAFPFKVFLFFLTGVICAVLPFIIWLGVNGALGEFWNDYFIANVNYSGEYNSLANIVESFLSYTLGSLSEVYVLLIVFLIIKKENTGFNISYLIFMIVNLLSISLSGKGFEHYGLVVVPTLVYPLAASSAVIKKLLKNKQALFDVVAFLSSIILIGFILNNYITTIPALVNGEVPAERSARILAVIEENTEPDEKILVLGYKDYYYVASDRLSSSKHHYVNSLNENHPDGLNGIIEDMNNSSPKLVIIVEGFEYDYLQFDFSKYHLIDEELNIWMRNEE